MEENTNLLREFENARVYFSADQIQLAQIISQVEGVKLEHHGRSGFEARNSYSIDTMPDVNAAEITEETIKKQKEQSLIVYRWAESMQEKQLYDFFEKAYETNKNDCISVISEGGHNAKMNHDPQEYISLLSVKTANTQDHRRNLTHTYNTIYLRVKDCDIKNGTLHMNIPKEYVGMVIGKGGSNINKIKENLLKTFPDLKNIRIHEYSFSQKPVNFNEIKFEDKVKLEDIVQEYSNLKDISINANDSQIEQIKKGLEAGLDVSLYTILNKEGKSAYDFMQMYEIRKGLLARVDVSRYMILNLKGNPVFDQSQMCEIRLGLETKINVDYFTTLNSEGKPAYTSFQMYEIREGLKSGIDVSQYTILNPEGQPIYGCGQMKEIREGLEAGVDISQFTVLNSEGKPVFGADQMCEIKKGLISGVDISQYTTLNSEGKPIYDDWQMRQIREGLEEGLDVSKYTILNLKEEPAYFWDEMYEIKEGLKSGIDVSQYTTLNSEGKPAFNQYKMREIREKLEEELKAQKDMPVPKEDEEMSL